MLELIGYRMATSPRLTNREFLKSFNSEIAITFGSGVSINTFIHAYSMLSITLLLQLHWLIGLSNNHDNITRRKAYDVVRGS